MQSLTVATDVTTDAPRLQAATARQIVQWMQQQGFYQKGQAESRWLLIFCLYWWSAFALGYAFEVEIFRDLQAAGVEFFGHDITNREERLSPFDLTVMGLRGDVKYSTWFLTVENARTEGLDFFITQLYDENGAHWLRVVLLTPVARQLIGGVTVPASSAEPLPALPSAIAAQLALVRYDEWKACVRTLQTPKGDNPNG